MKSKITHNLVSFQTIRRGDWVMKISVFRARDVLIVAQHYYDNANVIVKHFTDHEEAAQFIEYLAESDI